MAEEKKPMSRSEREAQIKDKAGWVVALFAAVLAISTLVGGSNSSKILTNTITANNLWAWYQAKNTRLTLVEFEIPRAMRDKDEARVAQLKDWAAKLESDPEKGEGKKEIAEKARKLEAEREEARKRSPWFTYGGSGLQIAIVLLTASILAVSMNLFWASLVVGAISSVAVSQAIWMWIPFI
jgi:hypothetical protein